MRPLTSWHRTCPLIHGGRSPCLILKAFSSSLGPRSLGRCLGYFSCFSLAVSRQHAAPCAVGRKWEEELVLSHSPSLRGPGGQERCPRTGERPMSLQSSKKARRGTQGTTGRSASPPSRERWWSSLSWRPSWSKWKKRRLSGVVSMDSPRGNHAWPIW